MTLTLVTALVDLGRSEIGGSFARGMSYYTDSLSRLMELPFPKVVYLDKQLVGQYQDAPATHITLIDYSDLQDFLYYQRIQEIRAAPNWYSQADWLPESPQCRLPGYNPLVMSKMIWLNELAQINPFRTEGAFWLDAGIYNNDQFAYYGDESFIRQTIKRDFSYVQRSCHETKEVHGFEISAFRRYCDGGTDTIVPGGIFGGSMQALLALHGDYMRIMAETLSEGYMGTEENLLTILAYQLDVM
ncbi:MAG: WlaTC/HtrL family glycosyltransferase [Planctomycetota bacterium]